MSEFFQDGPKLGNTFESDRLLQSVLKRQLGADAFREVEADLKRFGGRAAGDLLLMSQAAESEPPRLVQYDPWGRRVDRIETSQAWKDLDRVAAEEGIVATGYERKYGALSRLVQFAKLYLFHPSSAYYTCPLAMTDGAARALEVYGDDEIKAHAFTRLTSRDPAKFWTSGQWMTERTGGSDVSGTSTVARFDGRKFRLYGEKWFTSATTSQMAMTLARIEGAPEGSKGLSLFYLELRNADGALQGIRVNRLKDKLGTKALPTAELTLDGAEAKLIGGEGGGVRKIASLFNVSRMYNACCAVGGMRRAVTLARDYAYKRVAFGKPLSEHPLHLETLASMQVELDGAFLLMMHAAELLGKEETDAATPQEAATLRGLMPIVKLYTAKQSVAVISEALEAFGGAGYCEDTGFPRLLRDTQTLAIWEGTTNILSLDLLRAIEKEGALDALTAAAGKLLSRVASPELVESRDLVSAALQELLTQFRQLRDPDAFQAVARSFAYRMGQVYMGALMLDHAQWHALCEPGNGQKIRIFESAKRWCLRLKNPHSSIISELTLASGTGFTAQNREKTKKLGLDEI